MWNAVKLIISQATTLDWLLLALASILLLYIIGTWNYDYYSRQGFPSTKPKLPFVGDMLQFVLNREPLPDFVKKFYMRGKNHAIFGSFDFQKPAFMIRDPKMLKNVFIKQFDHFTNNRNIASESAEPLFGRNLFHLKDDEWRDMRATLSPAFTTSKIKGMFPLVSQCARQMVEHLNAKYKESTGDPGGLEVDMLEVFTRVANDIIATVAFGLEVDSLKDPKNEFYEMGKRLTTMSVWRLLGYFTFPKIMEAFKFSILNRNALSYFHTLVHDTILERQKRNIFRPDMLQLLSQAREGKLKIEKEDQLESENIGNVKQEISDEDVSAQAILFFFAGFETVSIALCFTSYAISHHPEVQSRLQQEVDAIWMKTQGKPTYDDVVQGMKYLDSVINETLRMYPPITFVGRECNKDAKLPATATSPVFKVHKGEMISIPTWGIHYDRNFWSEPDRFDPERFNEQNKHLIKPLTHIPFGVGPRLCIGQRLALIEIKLVLIFLMKHFHLKPSPKTKHPLEFEKGFNLRIKGGFWSCLTHRSS